MTSPVSSLFRHLEALQGDAPWGDVLDAGTGVNSALWSLALDRGVWTGVTGASGHAAQVRATAGELFRPDDELLVRNWLDPDLLRDRVYDTVLADYLVGAVEGFAPYFQPRLFRRLAPHVGRRLYVIGLAPYVVGPAPTEAARMVQAIGRMRDACLLLADETPYREYPAEWVADSLVEAGFEIVSSRRFGNRYREKWVHGQLDMALRRLSRLTDSALAEGLRGRIETLRSEGVRLCRRHDGLRHGADYVISAVPRR